MRRAYYRIYTELSEQLGVFRVADGTNGFLYSEASFGILAYGKVVGILVRQSNYYVKVFYSCLVEDEIL